MYLIEGERIFLKSSISDNFIDSIEKVKKLIEKTGDFKSIKTSINNIKQLMSKLKEDKMNNHNEYSLEKNYFLNNLDIFLDAIYKYSYDHIDYKSVFLYII